MGSRRASRGHAAVSFIFFVLTAVMAILLLAIALVVWLTQVTGSLITASLIVGCSCAFLALITYLMVIREAIEELRDHFETLFEVTRLARTGYEWVSGKLDLFLNLYGGNRARTE